MQTLTIASGTASFDQPLHGGRFAFRWTSDTANAGTLTVSSAFLEDPGINNYRPVPDYEDPSIAYSRDLASVFSDGFEYVSSGSEFFRISIAGGTNGQTVQFSITKLS